MRPMTEYPTYAAALTRQAPERQRLKVWESHASKVAAENARREAEWRQAFREAAERGEIGPPRPDKIDQAPAPFAIIDRQRQWLYELWDAEAQDAPAIRQDIDRELAQLEVKAKPLRDDLEVIDAQVQALASKRAELDQRIVQFARRHPAAPLNITPSPNPMPMNSAAIAALEAENSRQEDDQ